MDLLPAPAPVFGWIRVGARISFLTPLSYLLKIALAPARGSWHNVYAVKTMWGRAGSTGDDCAGLQAEAPPPSLIRWRKK